LPVLFVLQTLHALTFAAAYIGVVEFLARAVPEQYRLTAMTVNATLGAGLFAATATVIGGRVFDTLGAVWAYALMGGLALLGVGLSLWLHRRWDGGLLRAVPASPVEAASDL
jgi:PPP family 3-phenylpropionic acid transporter